MFIIPLAFTCVYKIYLMIRLICYSSVSEFTRSSDCCFPILSASFSVPNMKTLIQMCQVRPNQESCMKPGKGWPRVSGRRRVRRPERVARAANTAIGSHGSPVRSPKLEKRLGWLDQTPSGLVPGHIGRQDGPNPATHGAQAHTCVPHPAGQEEHKFMSAKCKALPRTLLEKAH